MKVLYHSWDIWSIYLKDDILDVVDAFTKTYAIPGLRLGFAVTQRRELLDDMQSFGQEFNVSATAQLAGLIAISDTQYIVNSSKKLH